MQPTHRHIILVLAAGLIAIPLALITYARIFPSGIQQRLPSPDGSVIAEQIRLRALTALDSDQITIQLRTHANPFRHTVFAGIDYGATLEISWLDSRTLLVKCVNCRKFDIKAEEPKWKNVSIHYVIQ